MTKKIKAVKAWAIYYRSTHSRPTELYTNDGRWRWYGQVAIYAKRSQAQMESRRINKIGNITMVIPVKIVPLTKKKGKSNEK